MGLNPLSWFRGNQQPDRPIYGNTSLSTAVNQVVQPTDNIKYITEGQRPLDLELKYPYLSRHAIKTSNFPDVDYAEDFVKKAILYLEQERINRPKNGVILLPCRQEKIDHEFELRDMELHLRTAAMAAVSGFHLSQVLTSSSSIETKISGQEKISNNIIAGTLYPK